MKLVPLGDTIDFTTTAHTPDGTSITTAVVTLTITDSSGSQVLSDTISHVTDGTYTETKATDGWALGPIRQVWTVKTSSGTKSRIAEHQVNIVNAGSAYSAYVYLDELEGYYPSVRDYLDNKSEDHVIAAYKYENSMLESLGYRTPIPKNADGFYDQSLRDYNAYEAIYRIINSNQADQVPFDENGNVWYTRFRRDAHKIYKDWKSKAITFTELVSPGEAGILPATRSAGSSVGTMLNNALTTYGSGFSGDDYTRTWEVTITGTGTSGGLRECTYKWSKDGGLGTTIGTTHDDWTHLDQQVYIRFTRGTSTGTTGIFVVGDSWTWTTNPVKDQVGGRNIAVGY